MAEQANLRVAEEPELGLPAAALSLEQSLDRLVAAIQAAGRELRRARIEYELVMQAARSAEREMAASSVLAGLTGQERRIALLAMAGSSDAAAAAATHLSVNTVKTHMKSVLRKLALHSRWQLTQVLVDTLASEAYSSGLMRTQSAAAPARLITPLAVKKRPRYVRTVP